MIPEGGKEERLLGWSLFLTDDWRLRRVEALEKVCSGILCRVEYYHNMWVMMTRGDGGAGGVDDRNVTSVRYSIKIHISV